MPRCAARHVKLVAEAELPILPFLAPSVFQPWPFPSRLPTSNPTRSFSARPCEYARRSGGPRPRQENARSLLVQQWYESAIAPLDAPGDDIQPRQEKRGNTKHHLPTNNRGNGAETGSDRSKRPGTRKEAQETHFRRWSTSQALLKSRWTVSKREPQVRLKWTSLGRPVRRRPDERSTDEVAFSADDHFLYWNLHFARLNARYDSRLTHPSAPRTTPNLNYRSKTWATRILDAKELKTIEDLQKLLGQNWRRKWMHAVLWTLANSVHDAPRLLATTHLPPYLPAASFADAMNYITQHYSSNPISDEAREDLVQAFCTMMDRPGTSPPRLPSGTLRRLLKICTEPQALRLIECTIATPLHWNTRLHIATYLANHNRFDYALDALLDAVSDGGDVKSNQFESACATILRKAATQPDGLRVSLRLVQNLSEIGVQLNVQLCNTVMLNAVEAGDLKTAFSIYHSLVDNDLVADKYTHAILLKGCKTAIGDSETLNTTIRQAIADVSVSNLEVVATEIIHCLALHHFQNDLDHAFTTILEAYTQLFSTSELIHLGVISRNTDNTSQNRMKPTSAALGVMISAYLRHMTQSRSGNTTHIYDIYRKWRELAERGSKPFTKLARTDHLANAFLMAFIQDLSGLSYAAEVIRDMQTPFTPLKAVDSESTVQHPRAQPTVQSFSIFLHGFAKHGKMDIAEQVLEYMRSRKAEPNEVTWNTMLGGYVKHGKTDAAVKTFIRMRDEGFESTEVTERHIGKIKVDNVSSHVWNKANHGPRGHAQIKDLEQGEIAMQERDLYTENVDGASDVMADRPNELVGGMQAMSI